MLRLDVNILSIFMFEILGKWFETFSLNSLTNSKPFSRVFQLFSQRTGFATLKYKSSHRGNFRKYLFFSSRNTFFWSSPGDLMCSPNRNLFSRKLCLLAEQIPFFLDAMFLCSLNRYRFPKSNIFGYGTDTDFSGASLFTNEQIRIFPKVFFKYQQTDR